MGIIEDNFQIIVLPTVLHEETCGRSSISSNSKMRYIYCNVHFFMKPGFQSGFCIIIEGSIAPERVPLTVAFVVAVNGKRFVLPLAIPLTAEQSVAFELPGLVGQTSGGNVYVNTVGSR